MIIMITINLGKSCHSNHTHTEVSRKMETSSCAEVFQPYRLVVVVHRLRCSESSGSGFPLFDTREIRVISNEGRVAKALHRLESGLRQSLPVSAVEDTGQLAQG